MKGKHVANKEADILKAAENEFLAKGYAGARTTSIARQAGVTHAMLHYYFQTKEQLFEQVLDEKMRLMEQSVLAAFTDVGLPLPERLRSGIIRHFDFIAANPDLPRFIINEVFAYPERSQVMCNRIRRITQVMLSDFQQELDELHRRGEVESVDVRMLLLDIVSLNIFVFVAYPLVSQVFGEFQMDKEQFFEMRKAENVEIIMRRIKKNSL